MGFRSSLGIITLASALSITAARAFDDSKYPNFSGVWRKPGGIGNQWDQTKPLGRAQEPPFTPEYQAIFERSLADIEAGGQGNDAPSSCVPFAMPRVMTVVFDMEIVITPGTTYMLFAHSTPRRILTDGSDWLNRSSRPSWAIRSANGSMSTTTAGTTCWRSRPVASRAREPMKAPACRFTRTTRPWSRSAFPSTRRPRPDQALDDHEAISPRSQSHPPGVQLL